MSKAAALPLFGDAYMADTMHLTLEEHGAYLRLLMLAWRTPDCSLPNDDKRIARMLGVGAQKWKKIRPAVMAFWTIENGMWTQKRLKKERKYVQEKSQKNAENAKARWEQVAENKQDGSCERICETPCENDAPPPPPLLSNLSTKVDKPQAANSDMDFWGSAKAYLGPSKASLIGKWVKDYGKSETAAAITAAQIERAVDPVPFIVATLKAGKPGQPKVPL